MSDTLVLRVAARFQKRAKGKRMRVFDFDDTLVSSKGEVGVSKAGGETIKMDSATFAHYTPDVGDQLDFTAFNNVVKPRKIKKNFDRLRAAVKEGDRAVILTARSKGAQSSVTKFLESEGIKGVEVVALGSSNPNDKAEWLSSAAKSEDAADVEFYDDSAANAKAVAEVGQKRHTNIKFVSTAVPHPKEEDYEGPQATKTFESDNPVHAVVEVQQKPGQAPEAPKPGGPSAWWTHQTPAFQENYCREHSHSKYCP
jgi:acid phosphatase class B